MLIFLVYDDERLMRRGASVLGSNKELPKNRSVEEAFARTAHFINESWTGSLFHPSQNVLNALRCIICRLCVVPSPGNCALEAPNGIGN
jgi:hypothetical protein